MPSPEPRHSLSFEDKGSPQFSRNSITAAMMSDAEMQEFRDLIKTPRRKSATGAGRNFMSGGLVDRQAVRSDQKKRSVLQKVKVFSRKLSVVRALSKVKETRVHNAIGVAMDRYLGREQNESLRLFEKRSSDLKDNFALPGRHQRNSGAAGIAGDIFAREGVAALSPRQKEFLRNQKRAKKINPDRFKITPSDTNNSHRSQVKAKSLQFDFNTGGSNTKGSDTKGAINQNAYRKSGSRLKSFGDVFSRKKSLLQRASAYTDFNSHLAQMKEIQSDQTQAAKAEGITSGASENENSMSREFESRTHCHHDLFIFQQIIV